jgi:hypothetical protein
MSREADFSLAVKEALAKRADNRCSFPQCPQATIGPSEEGPDRISNSGDAAHIVAASPGPGARRANKNRLSADQLKDIDNGIWMCATHARLIDRDEVTYTIAMLRLWRQIREQKAGLRQQLGREIVFGPARSAELPLVEDEIKLEGVGSENETIGNAVLHSCVHEIWGKELAEAVRDLAIELVRNAFGHGYATEFSFSIQPRKIVLSDNGKPFHYEDILREQHKRGGAAAMQRLLGYHSDHVVLAPMHRGVGNELTIALIHRPDDIQEVTQCFHKFTERDIKTRNFSLPSLSGCDRTYLILPNFLTFSDAFNFAAFLKHNQFDPKKYIIVAQGLSDGVLETCRDELPDCQIMVLP